MLDNDTFETTWSELFCGIFLPFSRRASHIWTEWLLEVALWSLSLFRRTTIGGSSLVNFAWGLVADARVLNVLRIFQTWEVYDKAWCVIIVEKRANWWADGLMGWGHLDCSVSHSPKQIGCKDWDSASEIDVFLCRSPVNLILRWKEA